MRQFQIVRARWGRMTSGHRGDRLTLGTVALFIVVLAGCGVPQSGRTFPAGTEVVYVNRTVTPIELPEGVIDACSEAAFDPAAIDGALDMRRAGTFPPAPPDAVDLTTTQYQAPGAPKPLIVVILAGTETQIFFGSVPDAELPPCHGRAIQPA